jgi:hypothetical protein
MSVSEPARHHLYEAARTGHWDDDAAEALMSLLPPVGWADVATKQDLRALEDSLRGEIAELRGEVRGTLRGEIGGLRGELCGEIGGLRGEIGGLHGEIGELRAEMHREIGLVRSDLAHQTRTMLFSLVGLLIAGAGVARGTAQLVS